MKLIKDLGMRFPKETSKYKVRYGEYECPVCLKTFKTQTNDVKRGKSTKCKKCASSTSTPNVSEERLYSIRRGMLKRCYLPTATSYDRYGGRGISICSEWRDSYESFKKWSIANGYQEDLTIDRIDNNGNYNPSNCRWATRETQAQNTSRSFSNIFSIDEFSEIAECYIKTDHSVATFSSELGISKSNFQKLMKYLNIKNIDRSVPNVGGSKRIY